MAAKNCKRININIPVDALQRIDDYAESMSINRTSAILVLTNMALDNQKIIRDISDLLLKVDKLSEPVK